MLFAAQDLAVGTNVETGIVADNNADVGGFLGDLEERDGLVGDAVEDENEVSGGM